MIIVCSPTIDAGRFAEELIPDSLDQNTFFNAQMQNITGKLTPSEARKLLQKSCHEVGRRALLQEAKKISSPSLRHRMVKRINNPSKQLHSYGVFPDKRIRNEDLELIKGLSKRSEVCLIHLPPTKKNLSSLEKLAKKVLVVLDEGTKSKGASKAFNQAWSKVGADSSKFVHVTSLQSPSRKAIDILSREVDKKNSKVSDPNSLDDFPGEKITLGSGYGGYSIPKSLGDMLGKDAVVYSAGIGEDMTFDVVLANHLGCNVHMFDPTPRSFAYFQKAQSVLQEKQGKGTADFKSKVGEKQEKFFAAYKASPTLLKFYRYGLSYEDQMGVKFFAPKNPKHVSHSVVNLQNTNNYFTADLKSLKTIMRENSHNRIDLLKIDIEGLECELLTNMIQEGISPKVISVDFDSARYGYLRPKVIEIVAMLKKKGYYVMCKGNWDLTFVDKKAYQDALMASSKAN
ncbi:MAG: FkbM family methyltransferase [Chlamydiales bacterium]|nr:FkbM family methyltransferase [Chlamydiales bacterium]